MSVTAVIIDLVKSAITDLAGGKSPAAAAEDVAGKVAEKVLALIPAAIHAELEPYLSLLGLVVATEDLGAAADRMLAGIRGAEASPTLPNLLAGADVQVMPDDWHPEPEVIAAIAAPIAEPTPVPDGSSQK